MPILGLLYTYALIQVKRFSRGILGVEASAGVYGADYEHVAPMRTVKRGIVEADGVCKTSHAWISSFPMADH